MIGHGDSDIPEEGAAYTIPQMIEDLHTVIYHMVGDRYYLMGYSMGARIALSYALEYESEIKGLILESGSVGIASDAERLERRKADEDLAVHIENHDGAWFATRWAEAPIFESQKQLSEDVESIIEVYEEHFAVGYEKGLTDSEIIKSLGTPEEIYASYVDAGIITDTLGQDGGESKSVNMQEIYARFDDYKERLLPQLPGMAKKASKTLLSIGSALSYIVGVLLFIITPAILYLLGSSWQPFENVTAFPALSLVTLVALGGVGLFGGLTCIFVGVELRGVRERYFSNVD